MNKEVNYKNKKTYKTARYPLRQRRFWTWLIRVLSGLTMRGRQIKVEKINMEGLEPPYMILSNHMAFVDFKLASMGTYPHPVNNVVSIDGYYRRPFLLEWIGAIATRKFTMDLHLLKSIYKVLERGDVLCMYPEARYTPIGTTAYMPESLGMLVKKCKVPIVAVVHRGNYLFRPFWDWRRKRKVPFHTTLTKVLTPEEIEQMSVAEINARLREALDYDEYKYQKENGIKITEPYRAEGLHKVLYKCPHCEAEREMASEGAELFCRACGKRWFMDELGELHATEGETEFPHIPDWFEWERKCVRAEVEAGTYSFSDEVDVHSLPRLWNFEKLGKARFTHDVENGIVIEGHYRGEDYRIQRLPLQTNSIHVEYDWFHVKPADCVDVSTEKDSFFCFFENEENIITKIAFAVEEIYHHHMRRKRGKEG